MYSFEGERFGRISEGQRIRTAASEIPVWRHGPPNSRKAGPAMCPSAEASARATPFDAVLTPAGNHWPTQFVVAVLQPVLAPGPRDAPPCWPRGNKSPSG